MLGPKLAELVTDDFARQAGTAYARSLVPGVELSDEEEAQVRELEAALEAMYLVACADDDLSKDELLLLMTTLGEILDECIGGGATRAQLGLPVLKLSETIDRFARSLTSEGITSRLASVARRLRSDQGKALAFRLGAGVAFVDHVIQPNEVAALDELGEAIGLSSGEQLRLLDQVHATLG